MDIVADIVSAFSTAFVGSVPFFTGVFFFIWLLTIPIWILKKL
jgi:hypothetical protein